MNGLTEFQFELSTAEEERNQFAPPFALPIRQQAEPHALPDGVYRVVAGQVFKVEAGASPLIPRTDNG